MHGYMQRKTDDAIHAGTVLPDLAAAQETAQDTRVKDAENQQESACRTVSAQCEPCGQHDEQDDQRQR